MGSISTDAEGGQVFSDCDPTMNMPPAPANEPEDEPVPNELAVATLDQVVAQDEASIHQVARGFATLSARVQNMPQTLALLQQRRKDALTWIKATREISDEDRKNVCTELLRSLNEHELACNMIVVKSFDVKGLFEQMTKIVAELFMKVRTNYNLTGAVAAAEVTLDEWNPAMVESELQIVERLADRLADASAELLSMTSIDRLSAMNAAIQRMESSMYSVDVFSKMKGLFQRRQECKKALRELMAKRLQDESGLAVVEARVRDGQAKMSNQKSFIKDLEGHRERLRQQKSELEKLKRANMDQALHVLQKLKTDAEKQYDSLQSYKESQMQATQSCFSKAHKEYQTQLKAYETELFNIDKHRVNHIVFCVDKSGSMWGARWAAALAALSSFRTERIQHGSQDVVSIVTFNTVPNLLLCAKPVTSDFVGELRSKVSPGGLTDYAPAWKVIMECADVAPSGSKLIVVFITDGIAYDIPAAAGIARELFQKQSARGGMHTFVVNIDQAVSDSVLEPLVKAGNGGQTRFRAFNEVTQLLGNVATSDLPSHFERLACLIDAQQVNLKFKIAQVQAAEKNMATQELQDLSRLEEQAELRAQGLKRTYARLEKASEDDGKQIREMLLVQLEQVGQELNEAEVSWENQTSRLGTLESEVAKCDLEAKALRTELQEDEDNYKKVKEELVSLDKVTVNDVSKLKESQEKLQHMFGCSDFETHQQHADELDALKGLCTASHINCREQANAISNLQEFFLLLRDRLRQPSKVRPAGKAGYVFGRLLAERGLVLKNGEQPENNVGFRCYLTHEAEVAGEDPCVSKKAIDLILKSEITPELLCAACEVAHAEAVEQAKDSLQRQLEEKLFEQKNLGKSGKQGLKMAKLTKKKNEVQEELEEMRAELPDQWDLVRDDPAREKKEAMLETLKEQIEELKDAMDDEKSELRELEEVKTAKRLVRCGVEHCRSTYRKQVQRQTLQSVRGAFQLYHGSVHLPMMELAASVDAARAAYDVGISSAGASLCNEGSARGGNPRQSLALTSPTS